jgi:hypothetical protein
MSDELKAIRARHEACGHTIEWPGFDSFEAHNDRATLLRLLDAAREELREVREAGNNCYQCEADLTIICLACNPLATHTDSANRFVEAIASGNPAWPDGVKINLLAVGCGGSFATVPLGDLRRLAAALKEPPTRAQGESS